MNKKEEAKSYYAKALTQCCDQKEKALICCRLTLLALNHFEIEQAITSIRSVVEILFAEDKALIEETKSCASLPNVRGFLFFLLIRSSEKLGIIFYPGFLKSEKDLYPETAVDIALLAWREYKDSCLLDFILDRLKQHQIAGELLPELSNAVFKGDVTTRQLLSIVEIAELYYDKELAHKCLMLAKRILK